MSDERISLFGARGRAKELTGEVQRLEHELAARTAEVGELKAHLDRLGAFSVLELEQRQALQAREIAEQAADAERAEAAALAELEAQLSERRREVKRAEEQLQALKDEVVTTSDEAVLQEVGVYEYRHPLTDSVAYQAELASLKDSIKTMNRKDGGAVSGTTNWTVNGSAAEGRRMVRDFSKLMLRAYNAEADNLVRGLKPYRLESAVERLDKVTATIERLGRTMDIRISAGYHRLRVRELELTADHVEMLAREKERDREEKARLREEQKAQQEMARERARLEKERQHHANALEALERGGDAPGAARVGALLAELDHKIEAVDYRAANTRAGYVYVISNLGAFGERIVKVGMTRRLEPRDRVRELGDASVPFKFDVHALFFSDDAVGIETALHQRMADRRVNRVNLRREFFYATPLEVKAHLAELTGELLEFTEVHEAIEYHQSRTAAEGVAETDAAPPESIARF